MFKNTCINALSDIEGYVVVMNNVMATTLLAYKVAVFCTIMSEDPVHGQQALTTWLANCSKEHWHPSNTTRPNNTLEHCNNES